MAEYTRKKEEENKLNPDLKLHELEKTELESEIKDLLKKKDSESPKSSSSSKNIPLKIGAAGRGKQRLMMSK